MISEKILQDWKLPPSSASDVFERNFFPDPKVGEKEIELSNGYASFPLFTENLKRVHRGPFLDLHVGMIQVGLKPTKLGSNTCAIICVRDKRCPNFHQSLMAMIESSLCDGSVHFSCFPTSCVSLSEAHLSSSFTIDIKTQGSSTNSILMYRFYYKVIQVCMNLKRLPRYPFDGEGETTLFLTNLARSNRVSRKIYWDQVSVPERWMDESSSGEQGAVARVDWKETAEAHVLKVAVPGFKEEEVKVEIEGGRVLHISGERREEAKDEEWQCVERSSGEFLRRYALPKDAKSDEVKAAMENGVLTVTMVKEKLNDKAQVKVIHISG